MTAEQPKNEVKVGRTIAFLGFFGLMQMAGGLLMLMYGVVVIIFRYAFHVELWNPIR